MAEKDWMRLVVFLNVLLCGHLFVMSAFVVLLFRQPGWQCMGLAATGAALGAGYLASDSMLRPGPWPRWRLIYSKALYILCVAAAVFAWLVALDVLPTIVREIP